VSCKQASQQNQADFIQESQLQQKNSISSEISTELRPYQKAIAKIGKMAKVIFSKLHVHGNMVLNDNTKIFIEKNKIAAIFEEAGQVEFGKVEIQDENFSLFYPVKTSDSLNQSLTGISDFDIIIKGTQHKGHVDTYTMTIVEHKLMDNGNTKKITYEIIKKDETSNQLNLPELIRFSLNQVQSDKVVLNYEDDAFTADLKNLELEIIADIEKDSVQIIKKSPAGSTKIPILGNQFEIYIDDIDLSFVNGKIDHNSKINARILGVQDNNTSLVISKNGIQGNLDLNSSDIKGELELEWLNDL